MAFLTRFLLYKQFIDTSGEFENTDALIQVNLIGRLMFFYRLEDPALLISPFGGLAVKKYSSLIFAQSFPFFLAYCLFSLLTALINSW